MISIENDGPLLKATNFWQSDIGRAGKLFVSVNAGFLRLLIPDSHAAIIKEIKAAEYVILSRRPWPAEQQPDAVELLFEDHSDSPFALHLTPNSFDMLPAEPEPGRRSTLNGASYRYLLITSPVPA